MKIKLGKLPYTSTLKVTVSLPASLMCRDFLPEAAKREAWYLAALCDDQHKWLDVILESCAFDHFCFTVPR